MAAPVLQSAPLPLYQLETDVFSKIPGMAQLRTAREDPRLRAKYPDAAFALMTAENLFTGDPSNAPSIRRPIFPFYRVKA